MLYSTLVEIELEVGVELGKKWDASDFRGSSELNRGTWSYNFFSPIWMQRFLKTLPNR